MSTVTDFQHTTLVSVYASREEFRVRLRIFAILLPVLICAATSVTLRQTTRRMPG